MNLLVLAQVKGKILHGDAKRCVDWTSACNTFQIYDKETYNFLIYSLRIFLFLSRYRIGIRLDTEAYFESLSPSREAMHISTRTTQGLRSVMRNVERHE